MNFSDIKPHTKYSVKIAYNGFISEMQLHGPTMAVMLGRDVMKYMKKYSITVIMEIDEVETAKAKANVLSSKNAQLRLTQNMVKKIAGVPGNPKVTPSTSKWAGAADGRQKSSVNTTAEEKLTAERAQAAVDAANATAAEKKKIAAEKAAAAKAQAKADAEASGLES